MSTANRDDKLADAVVTLRRHLRTCRPCIAALKGSDASMMCSVGGLMTVRLAQQSDDLIKLRIAAHNNPGHTIFACPKLSAHGRAYEMTAEPYMVTGVQGALF